MDSPCIQAVRIRNYKSIAECDVALQPLTFVLGRNGAGKSNFVDVFGFVADALGNNLDYALNRRGGIGELRRRGRTRPYDIEIRLSLILDGGVQAEYGFVLSASAGTNAEAGEHAVKDEWCRILGAHPSEFSALHGAVKTLKVTGDLADMVEFAPPMPTAGRLYLVNASGLQQFKPVFELLSSMHVYNLSPHAMKQLAPVDSRGVLSEDGGNIAGAWERLPKVDKERIEQYMKAVLPGFESAERFYMGSRETLQIKQRCGDRVAKFEAEQLSDGTIRALAVMLAALQERKAAMVGIEEPEIALHPAAAGALLDCLRDGAGRRQIIVTSQSPDLLDNKDIRPEQILAATWHDGVRTVAPLDAAGADLMRNQLLTAGELLRQDQIQSAPSASLVADD